MTIYLVGSGPADTLDSVHDQFVASARKRGTRIAVALLGTADEVGDFLASYTEPITSRWPEAEIVSVWLDDEPDDEQNTTIWPSDPESLAGFVVAGGWTPGYLEALRPHRELIAKLVRRGVPYLGFSAGAMIVGKRAIVGGWKFRGRQMAPEVWGESLEEFEMRDGLGLIGPSVDVHADVISLGRGLAALEKGEVTTVVSIDEGTCLVVDPVSGRTSVEGSQRIHWLTKEGHAIVVHHESSTAEQQRHEQYQVAEREAAEREQAAREAFEAKLAERRRVEQEALAAQRAADEAAAAERRRVLDEERAIARAEHDKMVAREQERREAEEAAERVRAEQERVEREAREAVERAEAEERAAREAELAEQRKAEQREQRLRQTEERRAAAAMKAAERAKIVEVAERAAAEAAALEGEAYLLEDASHGLPVGEEGADDAGDLNSEGAQPLTGSRAKKVNPFKAARKAVAEQESVAGQESVTGQGSVEGHAPAEERPVIHPVVVEETVVEAQEGLPEPEPYAAEPTQLGEAAVLTIPKTTPQGVDAHIVEEQHVGQKGIAEGIPSAQDGTMTEPHMDEQAAATPSAEPTPEQVDETREELAAIDEGRADAPGTTNDEGLLEPFDGLPGGPVETSTTDAAFAPGIGTDGDPAPEDPEAPRS